MVQDGEQSLAASLVPLRCGFSGSEEDREGSYWVRVLLCTGVSAVRCHRPQPNASYMLPFTIKASRLKALFSLLLAESVRS